MKTKGFTLVELLVMLVVLGILSVITIPNILGIIENNRNNITTNDVDKMYSTATVKTQLNKKEIEGYDCIVYTLNYLDKNNDIVDGSHEYPYDRHNSFILAKKETSSNTYKYEYYVRLIEVDTKDTDVYYGINFSNYNNVMKSPKQEMKKQIMIKDSLDDSNINSIIQELSSTNLCSNVKFYSNM